MTRFNIFSFGVFFISALVQGSFIFSSIMAAVWGAPVHTLQYVGLFSCLALWVASLICLFNPHWGRILSIFALFGIGSLIIPASSSLVPQHLVGVSPWSVIIVTLYFGCLTYSLFFPKRWRVSIPLFLITVVSAFGIITYTFVTRFMDGEYSRPSLAYFQWLPGTSDLIIEGEESWIDASMRSLLITHGITGTLKQTGSQGLSQDPNRVIVLCQRQIPSVKQLFYPHSGTLVYTFDGNDWLVLPQGEKTYSKFAALEPEGRHTMISQEIGGGRQETTAFSW